MLRIAAALLLVTRKSAGGKGLTVPIGPEEMEFAARLAPPNTDAVA